MVSVIIPALNEGATIRKVIQKIRPTLFAYEIIVVDDNSTDNTVSEALKEGARVITSSKKGKGISMHEGLIAANHDVVVYLDADIITYPRDVVSLLADPILKGEADFVKSYFDRQAGRVTQLVAKPLLSIFFPELEKFSQPLSGMIAARKDFLEDVEFENDYGVDIALLLDAYNRNLRIKEVNIGFIKNNMQSLEALGKMSRQVSRTILQKASKLSIDNLETLSNIHTISDEMDVVIKESIRKLKKIMIIDLNIILESDFMETAAAYFDFEEEMEFIRHNSPDSKSRLAQIAMLFKGRSLPELQAIADSIPVIHYVNETIKELKQNGYICVLLSEGFDVVANHVKNRLGFDYCFSNQLEMKKGVATGELIFAEQFNLQDDQEPGADNVTILNYLTRKFDIPEKNVVFISNATENIPMLKCAGMGIVTEKATSAVKLWADRILPDDSLLPILNLTTDTDNRRFSFGSKMTKYIAGIGAIALGAAAAGYYIYSKQKQAVESII